MGNLIDGETDLSTGELLQTVMHQLNHKVYISKDLVEKCLATCNFNNESNKYIHPENLPFDEFLGRIIDRDKWKFDKTYNILEKNDEV